MSGNDKDTRSVQSMIRAVERNEKILYGGQHPFDKPRVKRKPVSNKPKNVQALEDALDTAAEVASKGIAGVRRGVEKVKGMMREETIPDDYYDSPEDSSRPPVEEREIEHVPTDKTYRKQTTEQHSNEKWGAKYGQQNPLEVSIKYSEFSERLHTVLEETSTHMQRMYEGVTGFVDELGEAEKLQEKIQRYEKMISGTLEDFESVPDMSRQKLNGICAKYGFEKFPADMSQGELKYAIQQQIVESKHDLEQHLAEVREQHELIIQDVREKDTQYHQERTKLKACMNNLKTLQQMLKTYLK